MKKPKTISYRKNFKVKEGCDEYTFQIRKRSRKWWWLLLLLLLLLFIRCEREIEVTTVDKVSGEEIPDVEVMMSYSSHYLFKDGSFFKTEEHRDTLVTDADGRATFDKLGCSVFSYIFYCLSRAEFRADHGCYALDPDPESCNYHYTWHKTLEMAVRRVDAPMTVVDAETDEPLADASVIYAYEVSGEAFTDSTRSDAAGCFTLKNVPACGEVTLTTVSCYGYEDDKDDRRYVPDVLAANDSASVVRLNPMKLSFTYFVKNKYTREPVPGATVEVTLTSGNGHATRGSSTTNVDGKGRGAYEDAFVLAKVDLKATKVHYKEGHLEGDYTVEKFASLPDSLRVVYLEPEPYVVQFQNVDSISGDPIVGVKNHIVVESISGNTEQTDEISNRNGVFDVKAMEGDHITITSSHQYYETKVTDIPKFEKGQKIPMKPTLTDLVFRTVDAEDWSVLPDCRLVVRTSQSGVTSPTNSGNGTFTVKGLRVGENISITASKHEFSTNSHTISNRKVSDLMRAQQKDRDIPLTLNLPPCNASAAGKNNVSAGSRDVKSYNMGCKSGTFTMTYWTGTSCPDQILVYNHEGGQDYTQGKLIKQTPMHATGDSDKPLTLTCTFSSGSVITVVVITGPDDGSAWGYTLNCPK